MYVYLEEGPESWSGVDYRHGRDGSDKRTFIKGRMGDHRDIDFGIGTYFVPEGTGYIIEDAEDVKVCRFRKLQGTRSYKGRVGGRRSL